MLSSVPPRRANCRPMAVLLAVSVALAGSRTSIADVVVIANRTDENIHFEVSLSQAGNHAMDVGANQLVAIPLRGPAELAYPLDDQPVRYQLDANEAYYFARDEQGDIDLHKIDLGGTEETARGRPLDNWGALRQVAEIPVKLLVDNHEPTVESVWQPRLRRRVEEVSDILEGYCRLRLKIVGFELWDAGKEPMEFGQSFREFQRQVDPQPARLAIGFAGRYHGQPGRVHLGTTPGMLQSHILVREWSSNMTEPERTEVLLHEVGHFLGAVHSPDPTSVMRPILADNRAIERDFRIGFDPVNVLIINLVSEEIRANGTDSIRGMSSGTRTRLSQIYAKLAQQMPGDNSAQQFQFQLGMVGDTPLSHATKQVVDAVRLAARIVGHERSGTRLKQDQLTEYYVRRAAETAATLPEDVAACALLLGLGIALDDTDSLVNQAMTRDFCRAIETPAERSERSRSLGSPTVLDRRDLARHFFLSACLTAVVGAPAAESAGVLKELADAKSGSGWSYVDLAANMAGIAFAQRLLTGQLPLDELASQFRVVQHMPTVEGLPEGLRWEQLTPQLVGTDRNSFAHYRQEIVRRIEQLTGMPVQPAGN